MMRGRGLHDISSHTLRQRFTVSEGAGQTDKQTNLLCRKVYIFLLLCIHAIVISTVSTT